MKLAHFWFFGHVSKSLVAKSTTAMNPNPGYGSGSPSGYEQQSNPGSAGVREGKEDKGGYGGYGYGAAVVPSKEAGEKGEQSNFIPIFF